MSVVRLKASNHAQGRYANRIKNSSFVIDGVEYHVLPNENNNNDTLHGGPDGWDWVGSEHKCPNFC